MKAAIPAGGRVGSLDDIEAVWRRAIDCVNAEFSALPPIVQSRLIFRAGFIAFVQLVNSSPGEKGRRAANRALAKMADEDSSTAEFYKPMVQ